MGILWPHSNTVIRTNADRRAAGALAYFFQAGTATPRTTYQDANLTTPHAHPVVADAYGRFPAVFIDFGAYRERVKTAGNTQLWDTDDIPNPAPTDPGEGVTAESPLLLQTGDVFFRFTDGTRNDAVRANGRTIGSGNSGASERANDDCESLFIELYSSMDNTACPVSGGRGANAAADFAADKTLTLPDLRGRFLVGLVTMGNTDAAQMTPEVPGYTASSNATLPGRPVGNNGHTLTLAQTAAHTHAGTTTNTGSTHTHTFSISSSGAHTHSGTTENPSAGHTHDYDTAANKAINATGVSGSGGTIWGQGNVATPSSNHSVNHTHDFSISSSGAHTHTGTTDADSGSLHTHTFTTDSKGSGAVHNNVPNSLLGTWYIKL